MSEDAKDAAPAGPAATTMIDKLLGVLVALDRFEVHARGCETCARKLGPPAVPEAEWCEVGLVLWRRWDEEQRRPTGLQRALEGP